MQYNNIDTKEAKNYLLSRYTHCTLSLCVILQAREHLISIDPVNKTVLETIQSSLFVITLDEAKPYSTPENYTSVMHAHASKHSSLALLTIPVHKATVIRIP